MQFLKLWFKLMYVLYSVITTNDNHYTSRETIPKISGLFQLYCNTLQ